MKKKISLAVLAAAMLAAQGHAETETATFEDLKLEAESHWSGDANGEDWYYGMGTQQKFKIGGYLFDNYYAEQYYYWKGFG